MSSKPQIAVGADVTASGTHITLMAPTDTKRMEVIYSEFHPMPPAHQAVRQEQPEVQRLREALDQLANGSHLDAAQNHDDDSLREIARSCTCGERNRLLKHAVRVDAALAASTGQEVES